MFRILIYLLIIIIALTIYLYFTNWIETKGLYRTDPKSFDFSLWATSNNLSCIEFPNPISIGYYNDAKKIENDYSIKISNIKNMVLLDILLFRKCYSQNMSLKLSISNLGGTPYIFSDFNEKNLSRIREINNTQVIIDLINDSYLGYQQLKVAFPIDKDFYNYYMISIGPEDKIKIGNFYFIFKDNIWDGFIVNDNSFIIYNADFKSDPIRWGIEKTFHFTDKSSFMFFFNPVNKWWFLMQKIFDAVILGIIAATIYDLFTRWGKDYG